EEKHALDLISLVESTCDEILEMNHQIKFTSDINRLVLQGQRVGLKRAFNNLLINAVKYGCEATVRISKNDQALIVTIDDQGTGLPKSELTKVFEPFYRYERSRSRETGGTGLGLAIVKSIIEMHHGTIELSNLSPGGLRVTVKFFK
ncbi:MAG: sensor histidine kinase, partial [Gammaproteobacteria bacterium]|nr:sensor histidine kinase [Gammaproteobacteria bacterium]